jgi:hypothetical protein
MLNKKFIFISMLLSLLLFILTGCGCSIETVDEHNSRIADEASERSSILSEMLDNESTSVDDISTDNSVSSEDDTSFTKETSSDDNDIYGTNNSAGNAYSDNSSSSGNTSANINTAYNENTVNSNTKQPSALQSTNEPANDTSASSTAPSTTGSSSSVNNNKETTTYVSETETTVNTAFEETTLPYIKVHITISCSKVIGNENLSTKADLPKDGIILDTYVVVRDNDSVFTALKAAAEDNGIQLSYTGTKSAVYVSGIGGLYEKECGRYSGWKYSVNSVYPNVGCGGYSLSDGDNIFFGYVANYTDTY